MPVHRTPLAIAHSAPSKAKQSKAKQSKAKQSCIACCISVHNAARSFRLQVWDDRLLAHQSNATWLQHDCYVGYVSADPTVWPESAVRTVAQYSLPLAQLAWRLPYACSTIPWLGETVCNCTAQLPKSALPARGNPSRTNVGRMPVWLPYPPHSPPHRFAHRSTQPAVHSEHRHSQLPRAARCPLTSPLARRRRLGAC